MKGFRASSELQYLAGHCNIPDVLTALRFSVWLSVSLPVMKGLLDNVRRLHGQVYMQGTGVRRILCELETLRPPLYICKFNYPDMSLIMKP